MAVQRRRRRRAPKVIIALVVILFVSVIMAGAMSGWFDGPRPKLSSKYYGDTAEFIEMMGPDYDELIASGETALIFIDQNGCTTADRVREFSMNLMNEKGINVYKMMFTDVKNSTLHDYVKYYPSFVVVSEGEVKTFLRADHDEDADMYNEYEAFLRWVERNVEI
ncbi:hypothetical protein IIY24_01810 [Candidatus Saccharibacteria bacterium]|nr:hypothetical protein [Candidatus Saccharibacteria bacterium]